MRRYLKSLMRVETLQVAYGPPSISLLRQSRLSPFGHEHINMLGRYSFAVPDAVTRGELRPLRAATDA
jgi:hypothetical protein